MGVVTVTTVIDAPVDDVWSALCKINRYPKWDAFANEILSASHSRLKFGSTYEERSGMDKSVWRVTLFNPPRVQAHVGAVGFMGEVTREFLVEPYGEGTELRQTISFVVMPGLMRPFGWLAEKLFVERMVRKRLDASGRGLQVVLASGD
ncbi:MAG: SRPBCC family protein [Alphaproteobacteria bacterium]